MTATGSGTARWAWAEIDLSAIDHNVRTLRDIVAPATLWAVVKADGYGHGAVAVAEQALRSGAEGLCVALVQEGVALRAAGITAPILVLSEQPDVQLRPLLEHGLTPTAYSAGYLDALVAAGADGLAVHLKVDTGMQRVGVAEGDAAALVAHVAAHSPALRIEAVFTHLACADVPGADANRLQLEAFERALASLPSRPTRVHAANSAAALALPSSRFDLVRTGIAMYGISPGHGVDELAAELRPALSLKARVSFVKRVTAGSHVSYGWRHQFGHDTTLATVPLGYADGVPRRLGTLPELPGMDVLVRGRRSPIVGVVTMDQLMVAVDDDVVPGDEVVLIGGQGEHSITAADWADRLGTIGYEVVCGISARVPRAVLPNRA